MQIRDYIRSSQASGQSIAQIHTSLIKAGWTHEQIEPYLRSDNNDVTGLWTMIFIQIAVILIVAIPIIKQLTINNSFVSRKYGFDFTNIKGWREVKPKGKFDISFETIPNDKFTYVIASLDIKAIPNTYILGKISEKDIKNIFASQCRYISAFMQDFTYLGIKTVPLSGTNAYRCTLEAKQKNEAGDIAIQDNYFIDAKKYILFMSFYYTKDFPEPLQYIKSLMDGFRITSR